MGASARPHLVVIGKVPVAPLAKVSQLRATYRALAPFCERIDLIGEAHGDQVMEESDGALHVHGLPVRGGVGGHFGFVRYAVGRVAALEAAGRPDVYWLSDPLDSALVGFYAQWIKRKPVVLQLQADMFNLSRQRFGPLQRWVMKRLTLASARASVRVRTVSQHLADSLAAAGVRRDKLVVIPPRTDLSAFRPEVHAEAGRQLRESWGYGDQACVVLYVGAFNGSKGVDLLLEAAARVSPELPNLRWVLVGDGELRGAMEQVARERGLQDKVRFEGFVPYDELPRHYAASDAGVVSSRDEGIGRGGIQAAAMGLPVIMTDVGGNREVVVDGRTGWLVTPTVAGLADALSSLGRLDRGERAQMGRAGREHLSPIYDFATNIEAMATHLLPEAWSRGPAGRATS